jgi:hypothetical protein
MSQSFIRNLTRCAVLVLPLFLLSAQPMLASEANSVNSSSLKKQQPAPTNVLEVIISKPDKSKPGDGKLVQPQSGNRNYVFFNIVNRSSTTFTETYMRPSGTSTWIYFSFIGGSLVPGETQTARIRGQNTCYYDILIRNSYGDEHENYAINFCRFANYIIR